MNWFDEQAFWVIVGVIIFILVFAAAFVARNTAAKEDTVKRSEGDSVSSSVSITPDKKREK